MNWLIDFFSFWKRWEDSYEELLVAKSTPLQITPTPMQETNAQKFYNAAKADLGLHETLNENVPIEVGCAQGWSAIAKQAGIERIPVAGFSSTNQVDAFCEADEQFERIYEPELGATIVSVSTPSKHGHVGGVAGFSIMYVGDWGILSNDSTTGTIREQWSYKEFLAYYQQTLGLAVHMYRWKTPQA